MKNINENRGKFFFLCSKKFFDLLNAEGIPHCVIKGEALSLLSYNKVGARYYSDIDILVDKSNATKITKLLKSCGYIQGKENDNINLRRQNIFCVLESHQLIPYRLYIENIFVEIDLNFDVFWGEYEGHRIDIDEFISDSIEIDVYGVKIKTLPPIKSLIQLCLHHYKDMNSIFLLATRKSIRYEMFKDVYYLLKNNLDTIPLDKLYGMSTEYEIIPYVFYILYYTGQLFDDNILKQYIEAFRTPEGEALLNSYGLCIKERKEWKCDFKTRLESNNLYDLIKNDLTDKDRDKIAINKSIFMGDRDETN